MLSAELKERIRIPLMLAPAMAVVLILYSGGLILALVQSLGYMPILDRYDLSFDAYIRILQDDEFLKGLLITCWIGFSTTIFSSILAIIGALVLRQSLRGKALVTFIFQFNVPIPHIVGAIAILLFLSQSGMVSRITYLLGITKNMAAFPAFVNDEYAIGIILEYLWKTSTFTGIILLAVLQSIGEDFEDLARTLGANRWQRFQYVILPLIMPGLLRASILVFAFAFGAFEIPYILGQSFPAALPVVAFNYYNDIDLNYRAEAMATCIVIATLITALIFLYTKLTEIFVRAD